MFWKHKKKALDFPKPTDQGVIFSQKFASGNSHKSFITRYGGAPNCLTVIVTNTHLAITTMFPFTPLAELYDIGHLVPIHKVKNATPQKNLVRVEFLREDGSEATVSLYLACPKAFINAIESAKGEVNC